MKKSQPAKKSRPAHDMAGKKPALKAVIAKTVVEKPSPSKKATRKKAAAKKAAIKKVAGETTAVKEPMPKTPALKWSKPAAKQPAGKRGAARKAIARKRGSPKTIDEYIAGYPAEVQTKLQQVRATIRQAAPNAKEVISYQMPAFTQQGNVIYFAGYQHHIGLYPAPRGIEQFKQELAAYEGGKGTIKLPLDKPLPLDLIRRIVEFKVKFNLEKGAAKRPRR